MWPGVNADVRRWARSCLQCQRSKVHRHTVTPLGTFATPDARFNHIHIDLVGPLPPCQGYSYLLTCVDRFTRWPEAIPLPDITAPTVAQAFVSGWIARFGMPSSITTDRGTQFESDLFKQLMYLLGSHQIRTTVYHPAANGLVERFYRQLKAGLSTAPRTEWIATLPLVLLGIRSCLKEDSTAPLLSWCMVPLCTSRGSFSILLLQLVPNLYRTHTPTYLAFVTPCNNFVPSPHRITHPVLRTSVRI